MDSKKLELTPVRFTNYLDGQLKEANKEQRAVTLNLTIGENGCVLTHSTANAGHEARTAARMGYVVDELQYGTSEGALMIAKNVITNEVNLRFDSPTTAKRYWDGKGKGFLFSISNTGAEVYYTAPKYGVDKFGDKTQVGVKLVNSKGQEVDKKSLDLATLWVVRPSHYGSSIGKGGSTAAIFNAQYKFKDYCEFMNELTGEGFNLYLETVAKNGGETTEEEYNEQFVRFSAGRASSSDITGMVSTRKIKEVLETNGIDTEFMHKLAVYELQNKEIEPALEELRQVNPQAFDELLQFCNSLYPRVTYYLSKEMHADGESRISNETLSYTLTHFTGKEVTEDHVHAMKAQGRGLGTVEKAGPSSESSRLMELREEGIKHRHPESEKHVFSYQELAKDKKLAKEVQRARRGKFEGTRFKEFDLITLYDETVDYVSTGYGVFITLNEMKHEFSALLRYKIVILKVAKADYKKKVHLSDQVIQTALFASGLEAVKYFSKRGTAPIKQKYESIGKGAPMTHILLERNTLEKDVYLPTAIKQELPTLSLHNRNLFVKDLENVTDASLTVVNKNQTEEFFGSNEVIVADIADSINPGNGLLKPMEIHFPGWKAMKKEIKKELSSKRAVLEKQKEIVGISDKLLASINDEIGFIDTELAYLKKDIVFAMRHPKAFIGQYGIYKVVSMSTLEARSKNRVHEAKKTGQFYTEECHKEVVAHLYAMKPGAIMIPAYDFTLLLHSGADYDIDSFLIVADYNLIKLSMPMTPTANRVIAPKK